LVAQYSSIEGLVILEALINEDGRVVDVKILRSAGAGGLLDRPAVAALRQWEYAPLLLNGRPERFILTVTLSFTLQDKKRGT
jgi:TonB family protein